MLVFSTLETHGLESDFVGLRKVSKCSVFCTLSVGKQFFPEVPPVRKAEASVQKANNLEVPLAQNMWDGVRGEGMEGSLLRLQTRGTLPPPLLPGPTLTSKAESWGGGLQSRCCCWGTIS